MPTRGAHIHPIQWAVGCSVYTSPAGQAKQPPTLPSCRPGRTGRRRTDATLPPQTGSTGKHTATIVVTCGTWNHVSKQIAHGYTLSGIIFSFSHYIRVQLHQYWKNKC